MNSKERKIIGLTVVVVVALLGVLSFVMQGKDILPAPAATKVSADTNLPVSGEPLKAPPAPVTKNEGSSIKIPLDEAIRQERRGKYSGGDKAE